MINKRKKKSILINSKFQLNVLKYFMGLFILTAAVNIMSVVYFFEKFKQKGIDVGLKTDHVFFKFISEQETSMYWLMGGAVVVALCALLIGGFILSHKVAGPLYRLTQHLKEYNDNEDKELTRVKFREGDYFLEIENEFNRMVEQDVDEVSGEKVA